MPLYKFKFLSFQIRLSLFKQDKGRLPAFNDEDEEDSKAIINGAETGLTF